MLGGDGGVVGSPTLSLSGKERKGYLSIYKNRKGDIRHAPDNPINKKNIKSQMCKNNSYKGSTNPVTGLFFPPHSLASIF